MTIHGGPKNMDDFEKLGREKQIRVSNIAKGIWCVHGDDPKKCPKCHEHPLERLIKDGAELMKDLNIFASKKVPKAVEAAVEATSRLLDEIDPVAEAEVYQAYGRTAQAIEILKEGLQKNPNNFKAHQMLQTLDPTYRGTVPSDVIELNPNCNATFNSKAGWNCSCEHKHPLVCAKAYNLTKKKEPFQVAIDLLLGVAEAESKELAEEPFHAGGFIANDRIKILREAAEALKKENLK